MKYCPECGTELSDDTVFCPNCGTKVEEDTPADDDGTVLLNNRQSQPEDTPYAGGSSRSGSSYDNGASYNSGPAYRQENSYQNGAADDSGYYRQPAPQPSGNHSKWKYAIIALECAAIAVIGFFIVRFVAFPGQPSTVKTNSGTSLSEASGSAALSTASALFSEPDSTAASVAPAASVESQADVSQPADLSQISVNVTDAQPGDIFSMWPTQASSGAATSELHQTDPQYNNAPIKAGDGDPVTSWQEGASGDGVGERLQLNYPKTLNIKYIQCKLGNWRTPELYAKNNRPQAMTLDIAGQTYQLSFTDAEIDHYIVFSEPIPANSLIFTIDSVYSGKDADCCISEITPYAAG